MEALRQLKIQALELVLADIELLDDNAHYMPAETFNRLVANCKRDGVLTSTPFCWLNPATGKWRVLSGNHRVKAGVAAGIERAWCLTTVEALTRDEQLGIQLSHNALVGKDDPALLAKLYEEVTSVDLKLYTGLDDKMLDLLKSAPSMDSFGEPDLDWQTMTFIFLPEEANRLRAAFDAAVKMATGEKWSMRLADYRRFMDVVTKVQAAANVRNMTVAFTIVLDVFERHMAELADLWIDEDGKPKHKGWVPIETVLGRATVSAETGARIRRQIGKMTKAGELPADQPWLWFAKAIEALERTK